MTKLNGSVTVTVADPLTPSAVAVMATVPMPRPLTSPVVLTLATVGMLEVQMIGRVTIVPDAVRISASSWTVSPTLIVARAGVMATDAIGSLSTVTGTVSALGGSAAVMNARPAFRPRTLPVASTLAIDVEEERKSGLR